MIFRFGQIITIGILGGAGGYLIYKSKPSTRRIEAEYYERLEEEKRLQKENGINPTETSNANNQKEELASSSSKSNGSVIDSIKNRTNQLKTKTSQLKQKYKKKHQKLIKK
ncbi:hypothetical protein LY90DRAFT_520786 [Neocallimastix californiae]|uniref:Uncharacterized protein n=1 Tax=Neocallimastix californiae TaxID=1754190 RepID=A0A1Y1Y0D3_9FUNG|nr:hypothetical protein LY90DRAFT_520786 [Neocallimastix californiae]|eukprot:ORX91429.1 hypothetical protein LY90DRAFT_520786 [Neocallimastix californiae]